MMSEGDLKLFWALKIISKGFFKWAGVKRAAKVSVSHLELEIKSTYIIFDVSVKRGIS